MKTKAGFTRHMLHICPLLEEGTEEDEEDWTFIKKKCKTWQGEGADKIKMMFT